MGILMKLLFRKITCLLFMLIFVQGATMAYDDAFTPYTPKQNEQVYRKNVYKISAINPTTATNWTASMYPGLRGANQLVVYTPEYSTPSTGTNEYGGEAIVEGNIVTSLSGADSLIPSNGIVISAHGRAKAWLNKNIEIGTIISIDKATMTITAYNTSRSYLFAAKEKIEEATTIMNYYQKNSFSYNAKPTKTYLAKAKHYVRKAEHNTSELQQFASLAVQNANLAMAAAIPYKASELKGIWIRPTSKNEASIIASLDHLKATGINNIFLETYFHGRTIFPSETMKKYGFIEQYENFIGIDPLKIWITEAHKRGMKVNIWFESFYTGNKPNVGNTILAVKPEWSNVNLRNIDTPLPVASTSEHNGYFLDPANPEVQNFLFDLIKEIVCNYNPDGINVDYVRYPQSVSARYAGYAMSNWGYTQFAREEFKLIYGVDPVNIAYSDTKMWNEWDKYRQDKVTEYIEGVSKICRQNRIFLTAVVFPNRQMALETKQQDWTTWSDNNFIDGFTPLFLTCDAKTIKMMIFDMLKEMSPRTKLYAGLFVTFMDGSEEDLVRQIHETRKLNLGGIILFDYAHLQEKYIKTLTKSIFSNNTVLTGNSKQNCRKGSYDRRK